MAHYLLLWAVSSWSTLFAQVLILVCRVERVKKLYLRFTSVFSFCLCMLAASTKPTTIFSGVLSLMEMIAELQLCVWCVVQCCAHKATVVRQSLKGLLWGRPQNMPTNVEEELEYSSGTVDLVLDKISIMINISIISITKTYLYNFDPLKPHFYIVKLGFTGINIIFLISARIFSSEPRSLFVPHLFFFGWLGKIVLHDGSFSWVTVITLSIGTLYLLTILVLKFEIVHSTTVNVSEILLCVWQTV